MGYHIAWDNAEKTVVLHQYTDEATKDDLYQLIKRSSEMLNAHEHTIHLIVDERNITFDFTSTDLAYMGKMLPKNQGDVMVVVRPENLTYKTISQNLAKRLAPGNHPTFVSSIEEARQVLQERFGVVYDADLTSNA